MTKPGDKTIVRWNFNHLFRGAHVVWGKVNAKQSNPKAKKFCLSDIEISLHENELDLPSGRFVSVRVREHSVKGPGHGGTWNYSLAETLESAGAKKQGCIRHDSFTVFWKLKKGESFADGAMRIGKLVFKMLAIRIIDVPYVDDELLFSLFVVYKVTWVRDGKWFRRFDDDLRAKHKLPEAPTWVKLHVL